MFIIGALLGGLAGGLGGAAGGLATSGMSHALQSGHARKMARNAYKFAVQFDSTKYQRAVQDLKLANLNPILAISGGIRGGLGAAPMGPGVSGGGGGAGAGIASSAIAGAKVSEELAILKKEAERKRIEVETEAARRDALLAQAKREGSSAAQVEAQTRIIEQDLPRAEALGELYRSSTGKAILQGGQAGKDTGFPRVFGPIGAGIGSLLEAYEKRPKRKKFKAPKRYFEKKRKQKERK